MGSHYKKSLEQIRHQFSRSHVIIKTQQEKNSQSLEKFVNLEKVLCCARVAVSLHVIKSNLVIHSRKIDKHIKRPSKVKKVY